MLLFFAFTIFKYPLLVKDKFDASYRININNLLDQDEAFLYENEHFRGLVRRIHKLHPSLINPHYEIDAAILKPVKEIDQKYSELDELKPTGIDTNMWYFYDLGCFNCRCDWAFRKHPFDCVLGRYDALFDKKKKHLEERLAIFQEMYTVWETLEEIVKRSASKLWVEHAYATGRMTSEQYETYKQFERDAETFVDALI